ncbi:hypothetical protein PMAYCL1PPCAC_01383 [Pristionchus mayeri]|uniref:C2H2-type domain-containing protein n=1 Tax=Pristionchus mayeri TaxID=1317129 RepID=A0AAN5BZL5_9BILA|nr:hypothetical protein PMAYCL1PPCAC_01383 [Pristionchus mayeri]
MSGDTPLHTPEARGDAPNRRSEQQLSATRDLFPASVYGETDANWLARFSEKMEQKKRTREPVPQERKWTIEGDPVDDPMENDDQPIYFDLPQELDDVIPRSPQKLEDAEEQVLPLPRDQQPASIDDAAADEPVLRPRKKKVATDKSQQSVTQDAAAAAGGASLRLTRGDAAQLQQMQPQCFSLDGVELAKRPSPSVAQKRRASSNGHPKPIHVATKMTKRTVTMMACPKCQFRTNSAKSWENHLKRKHSTTPIMAGFSLKCECGKICGSEWHRRKCNLANFTVIRRKKTPQCVMCNEYSTTAKGYMQHLLKHHKSSLKKNGVYLKCACGLIDTHLASSKDRPKHFGKCNKLRFSLHKMADK